MSRPSQTPRKQPTRADKNVPAAGKPSWLKVPPPWGSEFARVRRILGRKRLSTVCCQARCPNIGECFGSGTATFLIMGERCTRRCTFCNIEAGEPAPLDPDEPRRLAEAARDLGLLYVVVTSVTRDDLADGGAAHFAATVRAIRDLLPGAGIEVLIPDLLGDMVALNLVLAAQPDVLNHNIETVPRLYPLVRPGADYDRSLKLLAAAGDRDARTKSGLMLGLGEDMAEVEEVLLDLAAVGCRRLTIGQYLPPSGRHAPLARYVPPGEFEALGARARAIGFTHVEAAPLVRSSYHASSQTTKLEEQT